MRYLFLIGVAGLPVAGGFIATGLLEIVSGQADLRAGFGRLVMGIAFGAAASRVFRIGGQARRALRRE